MNKLTQLMVLMVGVIGFSYGVDNQLINTQIKQLISAKVLYCGGIKCKNSQIKAIYKDGNLIWFGDDAKLNKNAQDSLDAIKTSYQDGLNPNSYNYDRLNDMLSKLSESSTDNSKQVLELDLILSDSFLSLINDEYYGTLNLKPNYKYWMPMKEKINLTDKFNQAVSKNQIPQTLEELRPKYKGYAGLKKALAEYQKLVDAGVKFQKVPTDEVLKVGSSGDAVSKLQKRLMQSGELASIDNDGEFNEALEKAVVVYQQSNGIYDDGVVGDETFAALNTPLFKRVKQIELNLDRMRLLPQNMGNKYVLVDIPNYTLDAYNDGDNTQIDVVVGNTGHPSCVLHSKINNVEFNPYWNVPHSIAVADLLPKLKKDPKYLIHNHMKVYYIENGKRHEVDPNGIDWKEMKDDALDYSFIQDPGKINVLGKIKFKFPNPCGIYLHDSVEKELFDVYERDFSHGCIRVGQPAKLAKFIFDGTSYDDDKVKELIKNGKNKTIALTNPVTVYIMYFTTFVDSNNGILQFRRDLYNLDDLLGYVVHTPPNDDND